MTWPQAQDLSSRVHDSDDSLLSIWRISWIAHILPRSPLDLLNGNIFHPEKRTLAYSDAVLLQGVAAAPLIWSGVSQVAVYNLVLLLSIALSGWAMWLYATHVTGQAWAGVLAGIAFAFVPFRFDHFMHLELQATFFLPLTLLGVERTLETRSRRAAALTAAAFAGQVFAGIYYAVFLATVLLVVVPVRLRALDGDARVQFARAMLPAFTVALIVITPYLLAYLSNRNTLGERLDSDIAMYSASLVQLSVRHSGERRARRMECGVGPQRTAPVSRCDRAHARGDRRGRPRSPARHADPDGSGGPDRVAGVQHPALRAASNHSLSVPRPAGAGPRLDSGVSRHRRARRVRVMRGSRAPSRARSPRLRPRRCRRRC